jgi:hypothetical protein
MRTWLYTVNISLVAYDVIVVGANFDVSFPCWMVTNSPFKFETYRGIAFVGKRVVRLGHVKVHSVAWNTLSVCEGVSRSFRTGRLERELPSATRRSCIAILWVSLVSFAAITLCVASQQVFIVVCFVMTQSGNFWIHLRIVPYGDGRRRYQLRRRRRLVSASTFWSETFDESCSTVFNVGGGSCDRSRKL